MESPTPKTLYSLQIGRGLAALAVVLHHCAVLLPPIYPNFPVPLHHLLYLGYFGVDFFFVLSGFIIAYVTQTSPTTSESARHYVLSRILRVYIPYYPVMLALLLVISFMPQLPLVMRDQYSLLGTFTLLPSDTRPALTIAWTLQHELMFYVLFGFCHFILRDWRLIFLWAVPIAMLHSSIESRSMTVMFGVINLEFLCGAAAFFCYQQQWFRDLRLHMLILGLFILGGAFSYFYAAPASDYRIIAAVGFSCIIVAIAYYETHICFAASRWLIFLGATSYAIYLVHLPLLSLLMKFHTYVDGWAFALAACIGVAIGGGALYHLAYEKPALRYLRRLLLRKHIA